MTESRDCMKLTLKQKSTTTAIVLACLMIGAFLHLRHRIYFLWAFDRSVAEVMESNSEAGVERACVAAEQCTNPGDIRFVEHHCVEALRNGKSSEGMVAFYVLLHAHDCLLDETVISLKQLAADPARTEIERSDAQYLLDQFEKKSPVFSNRRIPPGWGASKN